MLIRLKWALQLNFAHILQVCKELLQNSYNFLVRWSSSLQTDAFLVLVFSSGLQENKQFSSGCTWGIQPLVIKRLDERVMSSWRSAFYKAVIEKCVSAAAAACGFFVACWNFTCFSSILQNFVMSYIYIMHVLLRAKYETNWKYSLLNVCSLWTTCQNCQIILTLAIEQVLILCGGRLMEQCYLWSIGTQNHLQRELLVTLSLK